MAEPVLHYQPPADRVRPSHWPMLVFLWALFAPGAGCAALVVVADSLDDVFSRPVLVWIFGAVLTAVPSLAIAGGGACYGARRAIGARRLDRALALAANVLGWVQLVILTVFLAAVWRA